MKPVLFRGNSIDRISDFPLDVRRATGFQIERLQRGLDPNDWKPLKTVGPNVREIRIGDRAGAFRIVYVATFADAVYAFTPSKRRRRPRPDPTSNSLQRDTGNWFGAWKSE